MKTIILVLVSSAVASCLTFGVVVATSHPRFGGTEQQQVDAIKAEKEAVLKQYVYAEVRLNEVPTLDLSTVSADEMSTVYADLANDKGATGTKNLFDGLHTIAVKEGVACNPEPKEVDPITLDPIK